MKCPYKDQPREAWWYKQNVYLDKLDTQVATKFKLSPQDRIASAGSCFASRIAKKLKLTGYNYLDYEPAPHYFPDELSESMGYGLFSARYGFLYNTAQLWQLTQRAFQITEFDEPAWIEKNRYYDPFRPLIQPNGFASQLTLAQDIKMHLAAVKRVILDADVFIFTLGLTETWLSKKSGAILPVCPGCQVGTYSDQVEFKNLSLNENINYLNNFVQFLQKSNPNCKVILTVSPVPLIATMTSNGVIRANQYSKSVLRVCAEEIVNNWAHVDYFSSFELFQTRQAKQHYYGDHERDLTPDGIEHVMDMFLSHYFRTQSKYVLPDTTIPNDERFLHLDMKNPCDEEKLYTTMAERKTR